MIILNDLYIKHYCHSNCYPFMNICRLPEDEAYSLAHKMAEDNPNNESFTRFLEFKKYYPTRMKVDEQLYELFTSLGGKPKEIHPIFFVLHGSKTLEEWIGKWTVRKILLEKIPTEFISFTLDDNMVSSRQNGKPIMYTKETLSHILNGYETIEEFMEELTKKYYCIEAQLWNDDYCEI